MRKILLLFVVLILTNLIVSAQLKKTRWESDVCIYEGTFDSKKYTAEQLKNTFDLYNSLKYDMVAVEATVFKYEDIGKLASIEKLDADYARKAAVLEKLDIVNTPYWQNFKKIKLEALKRAYSLARVSVQIYQNPSVMKELTYADICVQKFMPPLIAGGDDLLNFWREMDAERRNQNGNDARQKKRFDDEYASADRLKFAQVNVVTFGWWNCANALIDRGGDYDVLDKNYKNLFKRVRQFDCEEP